MRQVQKEEGYLLDDFVVTAEEDPEKESCQATVTDGSSTAFDTHEPAILPRTPKKPKVSEGLINSELMELSHKTATKMKESLYDVYDSESLDALLGTENEKSDSEEDFSSYGDSNDEKEKSVVKKATKMTPKKKVLSKARVITKAEASPPGKKRSHDDIDHDDDDAVVGGRKRGSIVNPTLKNPESPGYRQLVQIFGLTSPRKKVRN